MKDKDYRAYPLESYSSLKYLLDSPKDFLYYKEHPFEGSPSTLLGTAIHHYLQGNRHLVGVSPVSRVKKKEFKEFEDMFMESTQGEGIIVPSSMEHTLLTIYKNFTDSPHSTLFEGCENEKEFILEGDFPYKGKGDLYQPIRLGEIKSSSRATDATSFRWEALERHYDLQAYMYQKGYFSEGKEAFRYREHVFVVANTREPFDVKFYKASNDFLESGRKKYEIVKDRYTRYIVNKEVWVDNSLEEI